MTMPFDSSHHHSPIAALLQKWISLDRECQSIPGENEDAINATVDRMAEIEKLMMAIPCETPADLAAKLAVASGLGFFDLPALDHPLWRELSEIVGLDLTAARRGD